TLLSAALQDYPKRRVVLLVDDPPTPRRLADIGLLAAARSLPEEIEESLRKPAEHFTDALGRLAARVARDSLDRPAESARLAQPLPDPAARVEEQGEGHPVPHPPRERLARPRFPPPS